MSLGCAESWRLTRTRSPSQMCASIMLSPRTRRANTSSPWPASADGATGSSPSTSSLARFGEPAAMRPRIGTGLNWRVPRGTVGVSVGEVLEVQTLGLGDPRGPCALGPVEEARTALRAERLGGRGRGRGGRSVGSGKRLGGGWHGRRRGRRRFDRRHARRRSDGIEVVQVQVCLDGLAELVARAAELTHRAADHPPELRELRGAEDEQRDHPDEEHFLEPDVEHGRTLESPRREPPFEPSRLTETYATPATRASSANERTTRSASGADAPPAGAYRTVRIPSCRAPLISDATLSPTIAVAADSSPRRSSAIRKSGGSGFPTTTGRTPAATATASTSAPHPGRNSPPSSGSRGPPFGATSGAPAAPGRAAAGRRSCRRPQPLPTATTVARR